MSGRRANHERRCRCEHLTDLDGAPTNLARACRVWRDRVDSAHERSDCGRSPRAVHYVAYSSAATRHLTPSRAVSRENAGRARTRGMPSRIRPWCWYTSIVRAGTSSPRTSSLKFTTRHGFPSWKPPESSTSITASGYDESVPPPYEPSPGRRGAVRGPSNAASALQDAQSPSCSRTSVGGKEYANSNPRAPNY